MELLFVDLLDSDFLEEERVMALDNRPPLLLLLLSLSEGGGATQ